MPYRIIEADRLADCMGHVTQALWPDDRFFALGDRLPGEQPGETEDKVPEKTAAALKTIAETVAAEFHSVAIDETRGASTLPLPFLDRYYRLFLQRTWEQPYPDPQGAAKDLFRLGRDKAGGNYSRNCGNYHHFLNVVAALARLIMYFTETDNLRKLFEDRAPECTSVVYGKDPDMRTFKLMLAAFYHDLGKAVVDPRHAMEGAVILAYHTTSARYRLHQIVQGRRLRHQLQEVEDRAAAAPEDRGGPMSGSGSWTVWRICANRSSGTAMRNSRHGVSAAFFNRVRTLFRSLPGEEYSAAIRGIADPSPFSRVRASSTAGRFSPRSSTTPVSLASPSPVLGGTIQAAEPAGTSAASRMVSPLRSGRVRRMTAGVGPISRRSKGMGGGR